ncbi:MAG: cbb3-type cytochrome oxidase assembly protein CcoS [Bacteriovoracaceae bacterium]
MEVIVILLPLALLLGAAFIGAFIWSARKGQYDDLETPRFRMLLEDQKITHINSSSRKEGK